MGVVDQLDAAFRLYRRNFATFLGIVAVLQVPLLVLSLLYSLLYQLPSQEALWSQLRSPQPGALPVQPSYGQSILSLLVSLALGLLGALANTLIIGALSHAVSRAYLGTPTRILDAYGYIAHRSRLVSLIVSGLLLNVVLFGGYFAATVVGMVIPCVVCVTVPIALVGMIYLSLRLLVVAQVVVLEDRGPIEALRRTWDLMQGHLLRALGLVILVGLAVYILPTGLQYIAVLGVFFLPFSPTLVIGVTSGVAGILQIAVLPILWATYTLFYYDLRIRKEGFDLRVQADQLAAAVPPA
jgi:hypothetical protein